jgi:uncharacterized Fe-S cluster protein YjdI
MGEEERKRAGVAREYRTEQIVVAWEPRLCIHTGHCVRGLPAVFDPQARPWVALDAATADEVAAVVQRCPTGALHFRRLDGGPQEPVPERTTMVPCSSGAISRSSARLARSSAKIRAWRYAAAATLATSPSATAVTGKPVSAPPLPAPISPDLLAARPPSTSAGRAMPRGRGRPAGHVPARGRCRSARPGAGASAPRYTGAEPA